MIETPNLAGLPQIAYQPAEETAPGIKVFEIDSEIAAQLPTPFKFARFSVEPNCSSPVDSHAVHEIWMIAQGTGELIYDDRCVRLQPFNMVYFEPPKPHVVKNDGPDLLVVFSVWWSVPGQ